VAGVLAERGGTQAREALLAALTEPNHRARKAVVTALSRFREEDVRQALRTLAIDGDPSLHVEGEAVRSLGRLRGPEVVPVCVEMLKRDSWGELIRARALQALGTSRDPAALELLLAWTADRHPVRTRAAAAAALGRLADDLEGCRVEAVDRLVELVRDAPFRVRMAAVSALGSARDSRGCVALRHVHQADGDGRMKRLAYESLQRIAAGRTSEGALGSLRRDMEALQDENRKLRDRIDRVETRAEVERETAS
jgi:aminopeptidase N